MGVDVSIVVCTRNRSVPLRSTLESICKTEVPGNLLVEALVVDNGSTDGTAEVVHSFARAAIPVAYHLEPRPGLSRARNTAIRLARGEALLFTDDDVHVPANWLAGMIQPVRTSNAVAVAGGVRLAPRLVAHWMGELHQSMLASTARLHEPLRDIVGANMLITRTALKVVPEFDVELGAGARGFCEETLYAFQLHAQGQHIGSALDTQVEHHFDSSRLSSSFWLNAIQRSAESWAYVAHHWEHRDVPRVRWRRGKRRLRLALTQWQHRKEEVPEGCVPEWKLRLLWDIHFYSSFLRERRVPRKYPKCGASKLGANN